MFVSILQIILFVVERDVLVAMMIMILSFYWVIDDCLSSTFEPPSFSL